MKKVSLTVFGILGLAASANAQGTWYTDQALWQSLVTNVSTATYTTRPSATNVPWTEAGVTATAGIGRWYTSIRGALATQSVTPVTFTFAGNAFGGMFAMTDNRDAYRAGTMNFSVDGSLVNTYNLTTSASNFTFLGYISDSASPISIKATPPSARYVIVDSFSFGQGTNPANPGSNVAPEPGTFALALTGGFALVGMCIGRRRMSN
jgi:hypothetical protein